MNTLRVTCDRTIAEQWLPDMREITSHSKSQLARHCILPQDSYFLIIQLPILDFRLNDILGGLCVVGHGVPGDCMGRSLTRQFVTSESPKISLDFLFPRSTQSSSHLAGGMSSVCFEVIRTEPTLFFSDIPLLFSNQTFCSSSRRLGGVQSADTIRYSSFFSTTVLPRAGGKVSHVFFQFFCSHLNGGLSPHKRTITQTFF